MKDLLNDFGTWLLAFVVSLVPAGLGAVVSLLVEAGLTWGQRITQVWVGIVVSYFVTNAANALFGLHPFVSQAIGFLVAMVAFKGAPGFIAGCSAVLAELPGKLSERLLALIPRKDPK